MRGFGHQASPRVGHFLSLLACVGALACSSDQVAGKPVVDETTNGLQARLRLPDGTPADSTCVKVTPGWYVAGEPDSLNRAVITDRDGWIKLESLPVGDYWIVATRAKVGIRARLHWDPAGKSAAPSWTMEHLGSLRGTVSPGARIRAYGSDKIWQADSAGRFQIDALPPGPMDLRADVAGSNGDSLTGEGSVQVVPSNTTEAGDLASVLVDPSTWEHAALFTVDADPAATPGETLADFPLALRIGSESFSRGLRRPSDLRVIDSRGTSIPFEVDEWDSLSSKAVVWANLPTAHPATGDTLRLLWGKPGLAEPPQPPGTDSVHAVWHFGGSAPLADASRSGHAIFLDSGTVSDTGILGHCRRFSGGQWMRAPAPAQTDFAHSFTISFWARIQGAQIRFAKLLDLGMTGTPYGSALFDVDTAAGEPAFQMAFADSSWKRFVGTGRTTGWIHLAATWDGSSRTMRYFQNGILQGEAVTSSGPLPMTGHDIILGNQETVDDGISGTLDEIHFDLRARSIGWIRHEAFSQSREHARIAP